MKKLFGKLRFAKSFFTLVKDPRQTGEIFKLAEVISSEDSALFVVTLRHVTSFESFNLLQRENYRPALADVQKLKELPDNTLGGAFARHMIRNGLAVDFFPPTLTNSTRDYLIGRARQGHDIWHVVTGFDTSIPGELGLQAFSLAQVRSPLSALILAGGILHVLLYNQSLFAQTIEEIFRGYQMGIKADCFLGYKFEDKWSESLANVKADLRV